MSQIEILQDELNEQLDEEYQLKEMEDKILLNEFIRHIKNKMADYEDDGMIITKDIMLEILSDLEIK